MRIVFSADFHLSKRQYGFAEREQDFCNAVRHIAKRAIDLKVDAVIAAGDIFDVAKPPAYAVRFVADVVAELKAAGIPVLGVDGNHDVADGNWLQVCGITDLGLGQSIYMKPGTDISISGLPYLRPTVFKERLKRFVDLNVKVDVFVIHQAIGELADFEAQEITALEMAPLMHQMGVRYVAMGDIHDYKEIEVGGVRFVYSGSPEVNAIDEHRDKSFSIIDIDKTSMHTSYEPIPVRPIVEQHLRVEKDLDNLLLRFKDNPMAIIWYDPENRELAKRAEVLLMEHKIMHRICPIVGNSLEALQAQLTRQQFERKGALMQLADAVLAFFDKESDQYQLVFQLLDTPDNAEDTVKRYLASKGITP